MLLAVVDWKYGCFAGVKDCEIGNDAGLGGKLAGARLHTPHTHAPAEGCHKAAGITRLVHEGLSACASGVILSTTSHRRCTLHFSLLLGDSGIGHSCDALDCFNVTMASSPTNPQMQSRRTTKRGAFVDAIWQCDCNPRLPADKFQVKNGGKNHGRWCMFLYLCY